MSGRVVHFEIPVDDTDRASEFYRSAFGWNLNAMPDMGYTIVATTPTDEQGAPTEPGAINGGLTERGTSTPTPVLTVDVEDIDAALRTVESAGGRTVTPRTEIEGMGAFAYFTDLEGNVMGLWQNP